MTKILVLAGEKQSGKSSAGQYVMGHILDQLGVIPKVDGKPGFGMAEQDGLLQVCVDGKWQVLDYQAENLESAMFLAHNVWPHVRIYHLADTLKEIAIAVFGIDRRLAYGTDEQKNTETNVTWDDVRFVLAPRTVNRLKKDNMLGEHLTVRQFLQLFGTDICRRIKDNCWVQSCLTKIKNDAPALAIVCDCRFRNEVTELQEAGGKVIRLLKSNDGADSHISEKDLDKFKDDKFDAVIDNREMTLQEKNYKVLDYLYDWDWLPLYKGDVDDAS